MAGLITKLLEGKIVITGENCGIGLVTGQQFVQDDSFVFITGRRQNELDKAIEQIEEHFDKIFSVNTVISKGRCCSYKP